MKGRTLAQRVGEALRVHRESLNMSQEGFADVIGMHRTYYSALERGESNVTLRTLERVCQGLKVRIWEVLKEADV